MIGKVAQGIYKSYVFPRSVTVTYALAPFEPLLQEAGGTLHTVVADIHDEF